MTGKCSKYIQGTLYLVFFKKLVFFFVSSDGFNILSQTSVADQNTVG